MTIPKRIVRFTADTLADFEILLHHHLGQLLSWRQEDLAQT